MVATPVVAETRSTHQLPRPVVGDWVDIVDRDAADQDAGATPAAMPGRELL